MGDAAWRDLLADHHTAVRARSRPVRRPRGQGPRGRVPDRVRRCAEPGASLRAGDSHRRRAARPRSAHRPAHRRVRADRRRRRRHGRAHRRARWRKEPARMRFMPRGRRLGRSSGPACGLSRSGRGSSRVCPGMWPILAAGRLGRASGSSRISWRLSAPCGPGAVHMYWPRSTRHLMHPRSLAQASGRRGPWKAGPGSSGSGVRSGCRPFGSLGRRSGRAGPAASPTCTRPAGGWGVVGKAVALPPGTAPWQDRTRRRRALMGITPTGRARAARARATRSERARPSRQPAGEVSEGPGDDPGLCAAGGCEAVAGDPLTLSSARCQPPSSAPPSPSCPSPVCGSRRRSPRRSSSGASTRSRGRSAVT